MSNLAVHFRNQLDQCQAENAQLRADNERLVREAKNDAIAYRAAIERQEELRAELDALKAQRGEPVAWVEVKDRHEGPYEFHGVELLDSGKHHLYLAPTATDALVEELEREFPLFDDEGLDEIKHHCEWALLQDRKRLHQLLATYRASQRKESTCR